MDDRYANGQGGPKPQRGVLARVMERFTKAPDNTSTAGKLANRQAYLAYVERQQESGEQALPFDQWAAQQR